ncbi:10293_t:CDS:2, partial [Gigaspora rosea]
PCLKTNLYGFVWPNKKDRDAVKGSDFTTRAEAGQDKISTLKKSSSSNCKNNKKNLNKAIGNRPHQ